MGFIGDRWSIGDTLYFEAQTQGSSGPVDADSAPTYRIYEQGGTTPVLTGTFTLRDATNTDGFYEASIALTIANGFEVGKSYYIRKFATVSALTGARVDYFRVTNAGATAFVSLSGWPTLADVQARFVDMGLTAPADDTITAMINAAVTAWENMTGYSPFLGSGVDETRYFSSKGYMIDFQGGLTDEPTTLTIDGYYDSNGAYQGGSTLTVNRDYWLKPDNALSVDKPYDYCLLKTYTARKELGAIKVVAPFGYAETVPADAWEAIMQEVLVRLTPQVMIAESGGFDSIKQGPVEWRNQTAGGGFKTFSDLLSSQARSVAAHYKRKKFPFSRRTMV